MHDWMVAELAAWAKYVDVPAERPKMRSLLMIWQQGPNGVRGEALAKLPYAERVAWQKFWADVAALLKKLDDAEAKTAAASKS